MRYRGGYNYQLANPEVFQTSFRPHMPITSESGRIELHCDGKMYIHEGYAWDGASWVPDTAAAKIASLGHDAGYQLCREGLMPHSTWREWDYNYGRWLLANGSWKITMKTHLAGLKLANGSAAHPKNRKKIHEAP